VQSRLLETYWPRPHCSYFAEARRYPRPKAFVTRAIFGSYLRHVILSYIVNWRKKLGAEAPATLLFDGHKTHLHELLHAWATQNHIILCTLPPHSSNLLQPLDHGFLKRLNVQYGLF
jgi:hypothetical protein